MTKEEYLGRFMALYAYKAYFNEEGNEKGKNLTEEKIAALWKQMREDLDAVDFAKVWAEVCFFKKNKILSKLLLQEGGLSYGD